MGCMEGQDCHEQGRSLLPVQPIADHSHVKCYKGYTTVDRSQLLPPLPGSAASASGVVGLLLHLVSCNFELCGGKSLRSVHVIVLDHCRQP
jgi:hypothetical protein